MKIIKYLIAAILVVSITKKVHVKPAKTTFEYSSIDGYDSKSRTAYHTDDQNLTQAYVGVVSVNPTVKAPNIDAPALKFIRTIPAAPSQGLYGQSSNRNLFGLPVYGVPMPVYHPKTHKIIGKYWPALSSDDNSNQIVQLDNGTTYVLVKEQQLAPKSGAYMTGLPYTWYDTKAQEKLLKNYGISIKQKNFKSLVKTIGTIKCITKTNVKRCTLVGVTFDTATESDMPTSNQLLETQEHMTIEKETIIPGMDEFTESLRSEVRN